MEIQHGGSTYMRITDDGCGIARADVPKVFISHATSKIATEEDLNAIGTLGFRGEAMASIGAVAQVELLTRTAEEQVGTRYVIAGGQEQSCDDAGCPVGTTVVVRDLFFNTPARMKFLKKDVTEGNAVAGVLDAVALSHPEIAFRLIRDGKQTLVTPGNKDLKSTVYSVFGRELTQSLIPVHYSYNGMELEGYVSSPHASRKSRAMQYFFINGRLVKSKTALAALEQAYKKQHYGGALSRLRAEYDRQHGAGGCECAPGQDRGALANEKPVFDLVYYGVKTAIETGDSVKEATFGGTPQRTRWDARTRRQAVAAPRSTSSAKRKRACKRCCKQRPARTFGRRRRQVCRTVPRPRGRSRCSGRQSKAQRRRRKSRHL